MTNAEIIEEKLLEYSTLFDEYLITFALPQKWSNDILAVYMSEVLSETSNRFLCKTDQIWCDIFKSAMLDFFRTMLTLYISIDEKYEKECSYIISFREKKFYEQLSILKSDKMRRFMALYPSINLSGYAEQMIEGNQDMTVEAFLQEWQMACDRCFGTEKMKLLLGAKSSFQNYMTGPGANDYKQASNSALVLKRYPVLQEILDLIGREQKSDSKEMDKHIQTEYLPLLSKNPDDKQEVDGVRIGDHLPDVLPSELVYLSCQDTEDVFYERFAMKHLQLMASKPPLDKPRITEKTVETPRLNKGPIIVAIDTSGSMSGAPLMTAMSLLVQLIQLARSQKRACYLITYSVRAMAIDVADYRNWSALKRISLEGYSGGTDGTQMLSMTFRALKQEIYELADLLIISDFEWGKPSRYLPLVIKAQSSGTRFYGLCIGSQYAKCHRWLDRIWTI